MSEVNMRKGTMHNSLFFKFPSTPHITFTSEVISRSDKLLDSEKAKIMLSNVITIEEKIDGANLGISFTADGDLLLQNRGQYLIAPFEGQWKKVSLWLSAHENELLDIFEDKYILFGEWCYAKHSLYYSKLPDWFIGFDVYDIAAHKFLDVSLRNQLLQRAGISIVPKIECRKITMEDIPKLLRQSAYGTCPCEGLYFRYDSDGWLEIRAKYVRRTFVQSMDKHWRSGQIQTNHLEHYKPLTSE